MFFLFNHLHYPPSQQPHIQRLSFKADNFYWYFILYILKDKNFNIVISWWTIWPTDLAHTCYKKHIGFPLGNHSYGLYDFLVLEVLTIQMSVEMELIIVKLRVLCLCLLTCIKTLYSNTFKKESSIGILDYLSSCLKKYVTLHSWYRI